MEEVWNVFTKKWRHQMPYVPQTVILKAFFFYCKGGVDGHGLAEKIMLGEE